MAELGRDNDPTQQFVFNNRVMSRPPSAHMLGLHDLKGNIFDRHTTSVCSLSPGYFIGSLLLLKYKQQVVDGYASHGLAPPTDLLQPVRSIYDVPLFIYNRDVEVSESLGLSAPHVLLKRASGGNKGLIMEGDLAGLILNLVTKAANPQEGMIVGKVWNNELMERISPPELWKYCRSPADESGDSKGWNLHRFFADLYKDFGASLQYDQQLGSTRFKVKKWLSMFHEEPQKDIWLTDALFYLCSDLDINIDKKNFHYSRPIGSLS